MSLSLESTSRRTSPLCERTSSGMAFVRVSGDHGLEAVEFVTDAPIEVYIGDEFIGVLHRDEDEGEVSYSLVMTILDMDLPPLPEL